MNIKIILSLLVMLFFISTVFSYSMTSVNEKSYYALEETSGTVVRDYIGEDNNGTLTTKGVTVGASGKIGLAYKFLGHINNANSYVQLNTVNGRDRNYSLSAWIKTTSTYANNFFYHNGVRDGCNPSATHVGTNADGKVVAQVGCGGSITSSTTVNDGAWHFVVFVFDNNKTGWLYVDNIFNGVSEDLTGGMATNNAFEGFGGGMTGNRWYYGFDGNMDEIGIWFGTMSLADRTGLYNSGTGTTYCASNSYLADCSPDPCTRTINQDWVVTTNIDCNSKTIDLGTGKLVLSTGAKLRLYDSNLTCNRFDINASGSQLWLGSKSWIKTG